MTITAANKREPVLPIEYGVIPREHALYRALARSQTTGIIMAVLERPAKFGPPEFATCAAHADEYKPLTEQGWEFLCDIGTNCV